MVNRGDIISETYISTCLTGGKFFVVDAKRWWSSIDDHNDVDGKDSNSSKQEIHAIKMGTL